MNLLYLFTYGFINFLPMTIKKMLSVLNAQLQQPTPHRNPIVYLDIDIDGEKAGRILVELRTDVVPLTAENFRALCTGERGIGTNGKPLHYKGTKFHKAVTQFMVQGGDIVNGDGTGGESIYGPVFRDENFILNHETGVLSMANRGRPNTNGSQFCITTVPCLHLDGSNVVFGRVLSGLGIVEEIQRYGTGDNCKPSVNCVIQDCGEARSSADMDVSCRDGTADRLPEYPQDCQCGEMSAQHLLSSIKDTKDSGKYYFGNGRHKAAIRKYLKCLRYLEHIKESVERESTEEQMRYYELALMYSQQCNLNLAACYNKTQQYNSCIKCCSEVLHVYPKNEKALYRRSQANFALKNYDAALRDLKIAEEVSPNNKAIQKLIDEVRLSNKSYNDMQKQRLSKFFRDQTGECVYANGEH